MKKLILSVLSAFCLMLSPAAYAGDFQGLMLGLNGNYSLGSISYDYNDGTTGNGDYTEDDGFHGFEYGGFIGLRHQFQSRLNLGIETGFIFSSSEGDYDQVNGANTYEADYQKSNEFYISLKPGLRLNQELMAYGILGFQRAEYDHEVKINGVTLGGKGDSFNGFHGGIGLEYMYKSGFSVSAEYIYKDYGEEDYRFASDQTATLSMDENIFRLGMGFTFNVDDFFSWNGGDSSGL